MSFNSINNSCADIVNSIAETKLLADKLKALEDKRKPIEPSNWQELQAKDELEQQLFVCDDCGLKFTYEDININEVSICKGCNHE